MNAATETAVRYLSRFSRTETQLRSYLKRKGFLPSDIDEAIQYLLSRGYLNDLAYAESYTRYRIERQDGPKKIRYRMIEKGISPQIADQVLKQLYPEDLQIELAGQLIRQRITRRRQTTDDRSHREATFRFLASRGFPPYVIIQAFSKK